MKGIDTNILVRFLVGDDVHQAELVYNIFKRAELNKKELFVPTLVVLELIWVLESVYEIERMEILDSINDLLLMPIFKFEHQTAIHQLTLKARNNRFDLSDLLIAHSAASQGCEKVITLDKKASQYTLFEQAK